jgi:hypothetical protein
MEETMIPQMSPAKPSFVTVMFRDTAMSFEIPAGATMGELAEHLADLREVHGGKPLAVDIQLVC